MRGKLLICKRSSFFFRITPADAGKTSRRKAGLPAAEDHPRGCGENSAAQYLDTRTLVSPPRMRGKPSLACPLISYIRITPADAGKTSCRIFCSISTPDHPRGCGENVRSIIRNGGIPGSPPRMRGKPHWCAVVDAAHRITPADAGKTCGDRGAAW